jgi:hypothetical protein
MLAVQTFYFYMPLASTNPPKLGLSTHLGQVNPPLPAASKEDQSTDIFRDFRFLTQLKC